MDGRVEEIIAGFKRLLNSVETSFIAKVKKDNDDTIDVADLNETEYLQVRKIATEKTKGFIVTPKVGSFVIISRIANSDDLFVSMFSEIEKIEFNGGENGGLVITPELKKQLEKMSKRIDGIMNALKNSATGAQDGGAAYKAAIVTSLNTITDKESFSDIENKKITH